MNIRMYVRLLTAFWALLFSSITFASPTQESLDQLLEMSGIVAQVSEFPGQMRLGFTQGLAGGADISEELALSMLTALDETVLPSVIVESISTSVSAAISEEEAQALLAWYGTDAGREITAAEEAATTPQAYQDMLDSAEALLADGNRVEMAFRLDRLLGSTDMVMELQRSTSLAVSSAMMQVLAPEVPLNMDEFNAGWESVAVQMRLQAQQMVVLSYVYTYRDIDHATLARYEAFLGKPESRAFVQSSMNGMMQGIDTVVAAWGAQIGSVIKDSFDEAVSTDV